MNEMDEQKLCVVCSTPTVHKCSSCMNVHYCSQEHQKSDWKQHKIHCTPVMVKRDPVLGRYLQATRDINTGDYVMKEEPLIAGPLQVTPPVCLGCYELLENEKTVSCSLCGWPFCSEACTKNEVHKPECHYTQKRGQKMSIKTFDIPHPTYGCITILRCLYQRDHNNKLWEQLQNLESHCKQRVRTDKWKNDKNMICNFILDFFGLCDTFTEEEIMRCCGIIQINGFEILRQDPGYVAVYKRISFVEHNCIPNCSKCISPNGNMALCAAVDIPKGAHLTVCYTEPLWDTEARRHHLAETNLFECICQRCSDVTELGTMYSAIKCKTKNCQGYLLPDTFIQPVLQKIISPVLEKMGVDDKIWKCSACKGEVSDSVIQMLIDDIGREIYAMPKGDVNGCISFLKRLACHLHPSHRYMVDVSLALAQLIGNNSPGGLATVSDNHLKKKANLCRSLVCLLEKLAPGHFRLRGSMIYELHNVLLETGRRIAMSDNPTPAVNYVNEAKKLLEMSRYLLCKDTWQMPLDNMICQKADDDSKEAKELSDNLIAALPSPL